MCGVICSSFSSSIAPLLKNLLPQVESNKVCFVTNFNVMEPTSIYDCKKNKNIRERQSI